MYIFVAVHQHYKLGLGGFGVFLLEDYKSKNDDLTKGVGFWGPKNGRLVTIDFSVELGF